MCGGVGKKEREGAGKGKTSVVRGLAAADVIPLITRKHAFYLVSQL